MKPLNVAVLPEGYEFHKEGILFEDNHSVIFQLKHMVVGCGSTAKFFIGESSVAAKHYSLSRWDNTGGWKLLIQREYADKEAAIQNLTSLAKYFV